MAPFAYIRRGLMRGALMLLLASTGFAEPAMSQNTAWTLTVADSAKNLAGNKKLVFETWHAFWRGEIEKGLANMADDVTWLIPGNMKTSGLKDGKDAVRKFRQGNLNIFAEQHHTVAGVYGDGDTVIMEMSSKGRLRNGHPYDNAGVTVWDIENGKIKRVREYVDTYKAMAVNAVVSDQSFPAAP